MRSVQPLGLVMGIGILAFGALGLRTAEAADNRKSDEEAAANAYSTAVRANTEVVKTQAAWLQAISSARKMAAETAKLHQQVRSLRLDNQVKTAETFFAKRERREQYRAKRPRTRPDHETYVRVCSATKPDRLLKYQYDPDQGQISWPRLLRRPEFAEYRQEVESLFALGSAGSSGAGGQLQFKVDKLTGQMRGELQGMVREVNLMEYAAAKNFIRGLAYEARFMPQLQSVAANAN